MSPVSQRDARRSPSTPTEQEQIHGDSALVVGGALARKAAAGNSEF